MDRTLPHHQFTRDQIRPHLATGFPWHTPEQPHLHLISPAAWWQTLEPVFAQAFMAIGIESIQARELSQVVREVYCDAAHWHLFDDALPVLAHFATRGWSHVIVSNHVPELPQIVEGLSLTPYFTAVFTSATTGYEKPHPLAFHSALAALAPDHECWMIGDNYRADIVGAAVAGIPGILVRGTHPSAIYQCAGLADIYAILEIAGK